MGFTNVGEVWTPDEFRDYLGTIDPPAWARAITLHHTGSPDLAARPDGFSAQLVELLYGEGPYAARFDRFSSALGSASDERVRWPMVSALSALVHPKEHVCIKPNVFREQARGMAPTFRYTPTPSGASYARLLDIANTVKVQLEAAGEPVRDLMDVFDFIHETLRPKARQAIEAARPAQP